MSHGLRNVLAVCFLAGIVPAALAQEDEARALIEKAVEAQGGLEKLSQKVAAHRKTKGMFHSDKFTFTGESFSDTGNRRRIVLTGTEDGTASSRALVIDGAKGWITFDGVTFDLDDAFLGRLEESAYADKVSALVTLLRDRDAGYKLTPLGESKVKEAAAVGVKVEKAGKYDVLLYFDKTTGLLIKSANKAKEPGSDKEVFQEVYYRDYQWLRPGEDAEKRLRAAKLGVDGPGLLQALRRHVPSAEDQALVAGLVAKLGHKAFNVRERASAELVNWGVKALPLLKEALGHEDKEVVRRAEKLLDRIGGGPEPALSMAALHLITLRRPAGATAALLDFLPYAPDEATANQALETLAAVGLVNGKADKALEQALTSKDLKRRNAALAVLAKDDGAFAKKAWRPVLVDGVQLSRGCSLYRDGELVMDLVTLEVHYYNRLDETLFTRP